MACFLIPLAFAIPFTILQVILHLRGLKDWNSRLRPGLLNAMMWGGVVLLALEHVWHGEIVPWPPFLTAMQTPAEIPVMIHEMTIIGFPMTAVIFSIWGIIHGVTKLVYMYRIKIPVTPVPTLREE